MVARREVRLGEHGSSAAGPGATAVRLGSDGGSAGSGESTAVRVDRLTVFNHLWAIAGFCEWTRWTFTETGWGWVLLVTSLALLAVPRSVVALAVFACTQAVFHVLASNRPWNHGLFMAMANVAILAAIARCLVERRGGATAPDSERILDTFAPALRASLVALYLMTFFHKLNADFVDPAVSCAGTLLGWLNIHYRVLPLDTWAVVGSIWATLFVELTVPVLLCFRRTAALGLALGAGFHLFLSQYGGLHGFAAMLFAFYFLFLPRAFTVTGRGVDWRVVLPAAAVLWAVLGWAGVPHIYRGLVLWDAWLLGVVVLFRRELMGLWTMQWDFTLRSRWAPMALLPLVVVLNGLSPYVGLKTETSWAMYSNLRTEVRPNHFLVPPAAKVFGYQDDLVEIRATSLPALATYVGGEVRLTAFELRRLCSAATEDFTLTYRRNGAERTLERRAGERSDPALCEPHPWLAGKLLRFRPVDVGAHARCRH